MDRYAVKMVPPNVAKDIRGINGGGKKLDHPYYKVEERSGSGKATCRDCGQAIKEGDPTVFFHYAPDGDNEWIRDRGTIHRDECNGDKATNDWTKCPKCRKQVQRADWSKHWKDHKGDRQVAARAHASASNANITWTGSSAFLSSVNTTSVASGSSISTYTLTFDAASRTRQLGIRDAVLAKLRPEDVPSYHGEPAYKTPDGWSVSQIKTMGDAKYEGSMLNHCLANEQVHGMMRDHYGLGEDDNSGEFFFPPPPPAAAFHQYFPDASDEFKEHMESRAHSRIMSLRDPDGIPKSTWWEPKDSAPGTEIREVSGFSNQPIKDKHAHRIFQYMRNGLESAGRDSGKFEHVGALPEGMDENQEDQARAAAGFRYEPVLDMHVHDLPKEDEQFRGQQYPHKQVTGHCGQCKEDREVIAPVVPIDPTDVPVPGSIPKSLRDRFMDQLTPRDKEIDLKVPKLKMKPPLPGEGDMPFLHEAGFGEWEREVTGVPLCPTCGVGEKVGEAGGDAEWECGNCGRRFSGEDIDKTASAYPKDEGEMREHMRTNHAMDDDADKFPDVALGVIHDSDHKSDNYGHTHEDLDAMESQFKDDPEVQRGTAEMRGKELGEQLWNGVKEIMGSPDVHCPECGTPGAHSLGKARDEDGFDYEKMQCADCGRHFDKDEAGSGLNFIQNEPQQYHDEWRGKDRTAEFKGNCFGCGKRTYAFTDGENDPRGPLGDHAASPLHASDAYKKGADVPLCFGCANDYDSYKEASDYGDRIWDRDPEAEAARDKQQAEWESRKQGWKQAADSWTPMWAQHPRYYANYGGFHCSEHDMYHPESKIALYDDDLVDGKPTEGTAWHELIRSCSPEGDVDFRGFEKAGQKQADTSAGEENEAPEATVNPAPMGYKPRVDPNADEARKKAEEKSLNDEVGKLQKNLKTIDQFAGSWKSASQEGDDFSAWEREQSPRIEDDDQVIDAVCPGCGDRDGHGTKEDYRCNSCGEYSDLGGRLAHPQRAWASIEHVASNPFGKELKKVRTYAESEGWKVNETKKGWQFLAPADKVQEGFSGIVTTHASPSDHRAFKNFLGDLKNHGGLIWPPERARQREEKQQKAMEQEHNPAVCLKSQGIDPEGMDPDDVVQLHDLAHEGDERVAV